MSVNREKRKPNHKQQMNTRTVWFEKQWWLHVCSETFNLHIYGNNQLPYHPHWLDQLSEEARGQWNTWKMQRVSVTRLNSKEQEGIENWTSGKGTMEGRKLRWPCKKSGLRNPATSRKNPHWNYSCARCHKRKSYFNLGIHENRVTWHYEKCGIDVSNHVVISLWTYTELQIA